MKVGLLERQGQKVTLHADDRDIVVKYGGRRQMLPTERPDGSIGFKRARTNAEKEMVADLDVVLSTLANPGFWAAAAHLPGNEQATRRGRGRPTLNPNWLLFLVVCLAGHFGSQRKAIAFFRSRKMWNLLRVTVALHQPRHYRVMSAKPVTRWQLVRFNESWDSDTWATIREKVEATVLGSALTSARHLGHFNPDQPLVYDTIDFRQHAIADGTVMNAPSSRPSDSGHRDDPASGTHTKAGKTAWGSKFVLVETVSGEYRGRYIIGMAHVTPKPGNTVGDEGAATVDVMLNLKRKAPGLHGTIIDTVARGTHIKTLYDAGMMTTNHPPAKANPNSKTGGRNAEGREEHIDFIRTHTHELANGYICKHRLHAVGSVLHEEQYDEDGNLTLVPLPHPRNGFNRTNSNGTYRWYLEYDIPCRNGHTTALIRIDDTGRDDTAGWSHPDRLRFYPVGSPQFGILYGRRNGTESVHHQWKTTAKMVPAYGVTRQKLYVLGYIVTHNAVADVFHAIRAGVPTILDDD